MIDSHCHLEQPPFDPDLDIVIEHCKKAGMKALITSCARPKDLEKTIAIVERYKGFVFASAGLHPEYVKDIPEKEKDDYLDLLKQNRQKLVAIGEVGLDYFWIKEQEWKAKQIEWFRQFVAFAKELKLPIVIHCRDAFTDTLKILESEDVRKVQLHMWGDNTCTELIAKNGWYVSFGPILATSKKHKKIARDMPLEQIMLETDSPWFGGKTPEGKDIRGEPTNIKIAAQKITEAKKIDFETVWKACGANAIRLFNLPIKM